MVTNHLIVIAGLALAFCIFLLGVYVKASEEKRTAKRKEREQRMREVFLSDEDAVISRNGFVNRMNASKLVKNVGTRLGNSSTEILFRKSKNPWGLTPETYCFIRYVGLAAGVLLAIGAYFSIGVFIAVVFLMAGIICFMLPKMKYQGVADRRESQWNQLYQFMWVIKHNIAFYDPKKTFMETEKYIREHTNNLPELEQAFYDFSKHWNGEYMDEYIEKNYGDFAIPKQLFDIILVSQQTGEFPENELNSLRTIIINKMNFHVQEVLSTVGMKATLYSTPFVLASVSIVVLIPVILSVIEAFG